MYYFGNKFRNKEHFQSCVRAGEKYGKPLEPGYYQYEDGTYFLYGGKAKELSSEIDKILDDKSDDAITLPFDYNQNFELFE